jgi:hypothetical protein
MLIGVAGNQCQSLSQQMHPCLGHQQDRQDGFEHGMGIGVINPVLRGKRMFGLCGQTCPRLKIVTKHACGKVLHDRPLGKTRDMLQVQAMLEAFESLLDAPALMIERAELLSRKRLPYRASRSSIP